MNVTDQALDLIKYFSSLGVGGGIAGLVFYFARRDYIESAKDKASKAEEYAAKLESIALETKHERQILVTTLKEVSETISANSEIVKSVRDDILRRK